MGAQTFKQRAIGSTPKAAFKAAREEALWEHGHGGYSGTLAEKHEFTLIVVPADKNPSAYADELIDTDDPRIRDKWSPAGCVKLKDDEYLFFGWASS